MIIMTIVIQGNNNNNNNKNINGDVEGCIIEEATAVYDAKPRFKVADSSSIGAWKSAPDCHAIAPWIEDPGEWEREWEWQWQWQ